MKKRLFVIELILSVLLISACGMTARKIVVYQLEGEAIVTNEKGEQDAYEKQHLTSGDDVEVLDESEMTILLDDDKYLYAESNTHFKLFATSNKGKTRTKIKMYEGSVLYEIENKLDDAEKFEVHTPNSTLSVRGTVFLVEVKYENGNPITNVTVKEGKVEGVSIEDGEEKNVLIEKGDEVTFYGVAPEDASSDEDDNKDSDGSRTEKVDNSVIVDWKNENLLVIAVREDVAERCMKTQEDILFYTEINIDGLSYTPMSMYIYDEERKKESELYEAYSAIISYRYDDSQDSIWVYSLRQDTIKENGWYIYTFKNGEISVEIGPGIIMSDVNVLPDKKMIEDFVGYYDRLNKGIIPVNGADLINNDSSITDVVTDDEKNNSDDDGSSANGKNQLLSTTDRKYINPETDSYAVVRFDIPTVTCFKYGPEEVYNMYNEYLWDQYVLTGSYQTSAEVVMVYSIDEAGHSEEVGGKIIFRDNMDAVSKLGKLTASEGDDTSSIYYVDDVSVCDSYEWRKKFVEKEFQGLTAIEGNVVYLSRGYGSLSDLLIYVDCYSITGIDDIDFSKSKVGNAKGILGFYYTETFDFNGTTQIEDEWREEEVLFKYEVY